MGLVTYSPGIQFVQGSLAKPRKKDGHKHGDYLIATHRTAATTNPNCTRLYIREAGSYDRHSPLSQREIQIRNRFTAVSQMIKARKADLSKLTTDQANFRLQKDNPDGVKTMKAYYWKICGAEYDESHS